MKIALASDLHMEHVTGINPEFFEVEADVLVLAGDICEVRRVHEHLEFFQSCRERFENVIVVMGNHEHYGNIYDDTLEEYRSYLQQVDNIHVLERSVVSLHGFKFAGATTWGGLHGGDPITCMHVNQMINDHRRIRRCQNGRYFKFTAEQAFCEHRIARSWLEKELTEEVPTVVVSHHLPSLQSVPQHYRTNRDHHTNGAYYSSLEHLMQPHVKLWCHGHTHDPVSYMIDATRVECNPRGYPGHHGTSAAYQPRVIELD